jgi:hypothetical protein
LKLFFPEELVAHFDITGSAIKQGKHGDYLEVEFTERNELPEGYSSEEYEAKDFVEKTIQDFPIRSHTAFSKLRRRRCRHKETGETISRDLSFIAEGTRFTKEVAAFFKELRGE